MVALPKSMPVIRPLGSAKRDPVAKRAQGLCITESALPRWLSHALLYHVFEPHREPVRCRIKRNITVALHEDPKTSVWHYIDPGLPMRDDGYQHKTLQSILQLWIPASAGADPPLADTSNDGRFCSSLLVGSS